MKKLLLILPFLLCLCSCDDGIIRKTPLQWCVWEIHKYENYDCGWSYIYNEIYDHDDMDNPNLRAYYITAFTDERIGEWFCYIECEHKDPFDRAAGRKVYSWDEVKLIDCDLAREELLDD